MADRGLALVLGGNGFLGSHLVDSLVRDGYRVRVFDKFTPNVPPLYAEHEAVRQFLGDFLNRGDLEAALSGVDYVFHLVSTTTPATAENDPLIDIETNIRGSVQLLQLCAAQGKIRRFVYASSGGTVYGDRSTSEPIREDDPTEPVSPYGIGKLAVENYLRYFRKKFGLDYTVFRIANPYGARQPFWRRQGVIPIFMDRIESGEPITVLGDGSMIRDYIYVTDVTDMVVATLGTKPRHEVYNLGSGVGVSVNAIIEAIENATGKQAFRESRPQPSTYVQTVVLDMSRYYAEFAHRPTIGFAEGIRLTYDYLREHGVRHEHR